MHSLPRRISSCLHSLLANVSVCIRPCEQHVPPAQPPHGNAEQLEGAGHTARLALPSWPAWSSSLAVGLGLRLLIPNPGPMAGAWCLEPRVQPRHLPSVSPACSAPGGPEPGHRHSQETQRSLCVGPGAAGAPEVRHQACAVLAGQCPRAAPLAEGLLASHELRAHLCLSVPTEGRACSLEVPPWRRSPAGAP